MSEVLRARALERPELAIALLGAALIATCGVLGLFEPTETRYAEIAREMLESGDGWTPRLDGIHHFHKPPLAYWAAASGMALAGVNAWGARLPAAVASLIALLAAAMAARRRFGADPGAAARVVWILGSMLLFATVGRALSADPFLAAAVALFWALAPSPWALAALGVGFVAKGPVVFVHTVLPVLLAALVGRDRGALAWLGPPRGWLGFAAIALPWYLGMVIRHPGLLEYLLGNQLWARYASTTHERGGPPWYFVAVLLAGALPWTAALGVGIARTWRDRASVESRLLLAWLVAPVAFLSLSGSKLPAYLLPCLPAAALLAARGVDARGARLGAALSLGALALGVLVFAGGALGPSPGVIVAPPPWVAAGGGLLGIGVWAAARGRVAWTALLVVAALSAMVIALAPFESSLGSPRRIAALLASQRRGEPVVEVGHFNAGLPFYLRQIVPLVEVPRESGFEDARALARSVAPRESLSVWVERHGKVWTFGPAGHARSMAEDLGLHWVGIARWRAETLGILTRRP